MTDSTVRYLVFDIESVADGQLVSKLRYPGMNLSPDEAVSRYRDELMEERGSDFIPYTYQLPVSVAIAKVSAGFELIDQVVLDAPAFRPHVITEHFWRGWEAYRRPTLVTFNGRSFDVPLLELAAFRFGIGVGNWFNLGAKSWEQRRNRYNLESHFDVYDLLTNFGASRFQGGLNLAANLLGKPGKMGVEGHMVQDLYNQGHLDRINDYCRCDVLDTYFVFLRCQVMMGRLAIDAERQIVVRAKQWLVDRAEQIPVFAAYLERWGDWDNPWAERQDEPPQDEPPQDEPPQDEPPQDEPPQDEPPEEAAATE